MRWARTSNISRTSTMFEPPPDRLQMDSRTAQVVKTQLERAAQPADILFHFALATSDSEAAFRFVEARLTRNPDDAKLLRCYVEAAKDRNQTDRAEHFLEAGLWRTPLSIPWHRAYQDLGRTEPRETGLAAQYDARLAKQSRSAGFLYLRGRVSAAPGQSEEFFRRACEADPGLAWPWMALAYTAAGRGDWPQARAMADKAFAMKLDEPSLLHIRHEARLACGDTAAMEAEYRQRLQASPPGENGQTLMELCDVLAVQGKDRDARQAVDADLAGCPRLSQGRIRRCAGRWSPTCWAISPRWKPRDRPRRRRRWKSGCISSR